MDPALRVQTQIRQNAEELSAFLGELGQWEKRAGERDEALRRRLERQRGPAEPRERFEPAPPRESDSTPSERVEGSGPLTPATIAGSFVPSAAVPVVPRAARQISSLDAEAAQRERGNEEFRAGDFSAAVKSYTRCLGMTRGNVTAFSNRAAAYLKLREFAKAEADCSSALRLEPAHLKSLVRRASARNGLGRHRAALQDLLAAQTLDPSSSGIRLELSRTREMLRNAVNRAPLVQLTPLWGEGLTPPCGPHLPADNAIQGSILLC